jgi:hypothetical protein
MGHILSDDELGSGDKGALRCSIGLIGLPKRKNLEASRYERSDSGEGNDPSRTSYAFSNRIIGAVLAIIGVWLFHVAHSRSRPTRRRSWS